jgi:hypothetical protein
VLPRFERSDLKQAFRGVRLAFKFTIDVNRHSAGIGVNA